MRKFRTALAYHVPQRFQVHGPILGGQVVSAHSPCLQTEPIGPLAAVCPCSLFLDRFINRDSSEGVVGAKLN